MARSADPRLRRLPSVERVLRRLEAEGSLDGVPHPLATACVRRVVEDARRRLLDGTPPQGWSPQSVYQECARAVAWYGHPTLIRAINATGILIHTNLGRAPLSAAAQAAVSEVLAGYTLLELDPETGERGSRQMHAEVLLGVVTGAEAALVVNNNAAAVLLGLAALASGREVIVSRGELVEIGGTFRMPDVMSQSGARLVEVGTTNKTYLRDYAAAVSAETGLLLKVHRSNFVMTGFVHQVPAADLAGLGRERGLPVMYDLGSGTLVDLRARGLPHEPTVQDAVAGGCDLVTFSGDKLLGGPQAGILVGRAAAVDACRIHPLARALRIDRLDLAALAATLRHYLRPEEPWDEIPVLRMLATDLKEVTDRALWLARRLRGPLRGKAHVTVAQVEGEAGGGSLPEQALPSAAAVIRPDQDTCAAVAGRLRRQHPPVLCRIQDDALLLDLRTVLADDLTPLLDAVKHAL